VAFFGKQFEIFRFLGVLSVITEDSDADDDGPGGGMLIPAQIPIQ
jgi:hypothetical protein